MGKETARLYVRFPVKINEELEVKNLCSYIEAVHLPRQKSARWCIVDFKSSEQRQEGIQILKQIKIKGKYLIVKSMNCKSKLQKSQKKSDCVDSVQELLKI
ncbi:uncharacterized protein LOC123674947 [Harmonia axyridis]|uniref:uncharacterized protein LOC123674947 n=1 Tax=Harmonia axyridis TaxID=115357 RepID=UPI001E2795B5|nr:uncharacterized protein LOC123674947 [Harmonia axyridis]